MSTSNSGQIFRSLEWRVTWRKPGWRRRYPMGKRFRAITQAYEHFRKLKRDPEFVDVALEVRACGPWADVEDPDERVKYDDLLSEANARAREGSPPVGGVSGDEVTTKARA
jgi:hypothetical protein